MGRSEELLNIFHNWTEDCSEIVSDYQLPQPCQEILERANDIKKRYGRGSINKVVLHPVADLPDFGILQTLINSLPKKQEGQESSSCQVPQLTKCDVKIFLIILSGYRFDPCSKLKWEIWQMLEGHYGDLVEEIILVWNNPDLLDSTDGEKAEPGRILVMFHCDYSYNDKCRSGILGKMAFKTTFLIITNQICSPIKSHFSWWLWSFPSPRCNKH